MRAGVWELALTAILNLMAVTLRMGTRGDDGVSRCILSTEKARTARPAADLIKTDALFYLGSKGFSRSFAALITKSASAAQSGCPA